MGNGISGTEFPKLARIEVALEALVDAVGGVVDVSSCTREGLERLPWSGRWLVPRAGSRLNY